MYSGTGKAAWSMIFRLEQNLCCCQLATSGNNLYRVYAVRLQEYTRKKNQIVYGTFFSFVQHPVCISCVFRYELYVVCFFCRWDTPAILLGIRKNSLSLSRARISTSLHFENRITSTVKFIFWFCIRIFRHSSCLSAGLSFKIIFFWGRKMFAKQFARITKKPKQR